MHPDPHDDSDPYEIFLPERRGANLYERTQPEELIQSSAHSTSSDTDALNVPSHITLYSGHHQLVVPFKDYIKNIASRGNCPAIESAALGANILIQTSKALEKIASGHFEALNNDFDIAGNIDGNFDYVPERHIFNNVAGIVDELWGLHFVAKDISAPAPVLDSEWQHSARALAIRGYNPVQIVKYLCPHLELARFEEFDLASFDSAHAKEDDGSITTMNVNEPALNQTNPLSPAALMALRMFRSRRH